MDVPEVIVFIDSDTEGEMEVIMRKLKKKFRSMASFKDCAVASTSGEQKLRKKTSINTSTQAAIDDDGIELDIQQAMPSVSKSKKRRLKRKRRLSCRLERLLSVRGKLDTIEEIDCQDSDSQCTSSSLTDSVDSGVETTDIWATYSDSDSVDVKLPMSSSCKSCRSNQNNSAKSAKRKRTLGAEDAPVASKYSKKEDALDGLRTDSQKRETKAMDCDSQDETSCPAVFDKSNYVAMDCEFVGVGKGKLSALGKNDINFFYVLF